MSNALSEDGLSMIKAPALMAVVTALILCGCDGGRGPVLLNSTGGYVMVAAHRVDPGTGLRGPNMMEDPLLPGHATRIPAGEGSVLVYDEDGDCYRLSPSSPTAETASDTLRVTLEGLTLHNIHAGVGSVPVSVVNRLQTKAYRVTERHHAFFDHDYLGTATLWPSETLTVWTDGDTLRLWVEDQGGAVLAPAELPLTGAPSVMELDSTQILRGNLRATIGEGPLRLRVVSLLPTMKVARMSLIEAGQAPDSALQTVLAASAQPPLDTLDAVVMGCAPGRYSLRLELNDGTVFATSSFGLSRDTSRVFLRPDLLRPADATGQGP